MKNRLAAFLPFLPLALLAQERLRETVYPGRIWATHTPEEAGLAREKLEALRDLVGGRGCVVRHGFMVFSWGDQTKSSDVASAMKPVISTLLLMAVQEGKLKSADAPVADFEPRLKTLNAGKDAGITWRHLASQMSGYGLAESPGQAYSYNDYALTLYYDTLTKKVFGTNGTEVLRTRLAEPLEFEDRYTFDAFGPNNRPGRLALSVRDFARFGLLYLRHGKWHDRQLLGPEAAHMAIHSPIPASTPLTGGQIADMLPGQRSMGGGRNITPVGPGYYSFNWWLNRTNKLGHRLFVDAPPDTYVASGHGGMRVLWLIPSLELIVCWNDSKIEDHDQSPGNPNTQCNQAARLMVEATLGEGGLPRPPTNANQGAGGTAPSRRTVLATDGAAFIVNGRPTFLHGLSFYGALGAPEDFIRRDLDDAQRYSFNWIRVWATWGTFGNDVSAVDTEGNPREPLMTKLKWLVAECDRRGLIMDISLSRGNGVTGPARLKTHEVHRRAAESLVTALKPWRNWYLDLSNERNVKDQRFTSVEDLKDLRQLVRQLDPQRLVTASHAGDISRDELREYLQTVQVDFISPHRPRNANSPAQTEAKTREYLAWMKEIGRVTPVHYQEPFRRGYGKWNPKADDFVADFRGAKAGGAAGWCFHNGDTRDRPDGEPRRSFGMSEKRLFDQLDEQERKVIEALKNAAVGGHP